MGDIESAAVDGCNAYREWLAEAVAERYTGTNDETLVEAARLLDRLMPQ